MIKEYIGNPEILNLHKTAFLCSRKIPASAVLKCYDWAIKMRDEGKCVISGFHSQIEKDVLYYLLQGTQPIIVALARGLKQRLEPELKTPLDKGRLLLITPFSKEIRRITSDTAIVRNRIMIDLADAIAIGYANPNGNLSNLVNITNKEILFL